MKKTSMWYLLLNAEGKTVFFAVAVVVRLGIFFGWDELEQTQVLSLAVPNMGIGNFHIMQIGSLRPFTPLKTNMTMEHPTIWRCISY